MCLTRRARQVRFTDRSGEWMRGAWRLTIAGLAAGLLTAPHIALAQQASQPTSNTPATDAIGPRELQNFSLQGNVTRPADQTATVPVRTRAPREEQPAADPSADREPARRVAETPKTAPRQSAPPPPQVAEARPEPQSITPPVSVAAASPAPPMARVTSPELPPPSSGISADTLAPEHHFSLLPWLLAALALGAGGAFLFWLNRPRPALAGGAELDFFSAPEAAPLPPAPPASPPAPTPAPAPPPVRPRAEAPSPPPASLGIVSTSLRPWIDISVQPLRCIVTEQSVTIEFELELFNSGNAPARDLYVEAVVVNAGPDQDQELAQFFARTAREGNPIEVIHPLSRTAFPTKVVTVRDHITVFEAAGRQVFVPLLAFNVFYRRGSTDAQSSAAYLLGRDTNGGKMAPLRLDQGARAVTGIGARQLPNGVRR